MLIPKIVTALFGVIFNFLGAYWYGILGIVGAGFLFSIMYFIWMVMLVNERGVKNVFA